MNHSKNIHSLGMGAVEDENPLEPCHPKYPERLQAGMFESRAPAHFGLCGKKGKGTMSSDEKLVADFGTGLRRIVIGLVVEILFRFGADNVTAHRVRVFCSRSSSRRRLSSQ